MKLQSIFSNIQYLDIFMGLSLLILVFSFVFILDWNGQESFHGSASEIQKLEKRIEILEKQNISYMSLK